MQGDQLPQNTLSISNQYLGYIYKLNSPDASREISSVLISASHCIALTSQIQSLVQGNKETMMHSQRSILCFSISPNASSRIKRTYDLRSTPYSLLELDTPLGEQYGYLGILNPTYQYFYKYQDAAQSISPLNSLGNNPQECYEIYDVDQKSIKVGAQQNFQKQSINNDTNLKSSWMVINDPYIGQSLLGWLEQNGSIALIPVKEIFSVILNIDATELLQHQSEEKSMVHSKNVEVVEVQDGSGEEIKDMCATRLNHSAFLICEKDIIRFYNSIDNSLKNEFHSKQIIKSICVSLDSRYLFISQGRSLLRIEWQNNLEVNGSIEFESKINCIQSMQFQNIKNTIMCGSSTENIYIVNGNNMQLLFTINQKLNSAEIIQLASIPQNMIASAGGKGEVKLYNMEGDCIRCFEGHKKDGAVRFITSDPSDASKMITAGEDKTIRVWEVQTGQQLRKIQLANEIKAAVVLNKYELAAGDSSNVRIFDTRSWEYQKLCNHKSRINCLVKLNESRFITGDESGRVLKFQFDKNSSNIAQCTLSNFQQVRSNQYYSIYLLSSQSSTLKMSNQEQRQLLQQQYEYEEGNTQSELSFQNAISSSQVLNASKQSQQLRLNQFQLTQSVSLLQSHQLQQQQQQSQEQSQQSRSYCNTIHQQGQYRQSEQQLCVSGDIQTFIQSVPSSQKSNLFEDQSNFYTLHPQLEQLSTSQSILNNQEISIQDTTILSSTKTPQKNQPIIRAQSQSAKPQALPLQVIQLNSPAQVSAFVTPKQTPLKGQSLKGKCISDDACFKNNFDDALKQRSPFIMNQNSSYCPSSSNIENNSNSKAQQQQQSSIQICQCQKVSSLVASLSKEKREAQSEVSNLRQEVIRLQRMSVQNCNLQSEVAILKTQQQQNQQTIQQLSLTIRNIFLLKEQETKRANKLESELNMLKQKNTNYNSSHTNNENNTEQLMLSPSAENNNSNDISISEIQAFDTQQTISTIDNHFNLLD